MQQLVTALDNVGIDYIWYVITSDMGGIDSPNVIFIDNRLDVWKWIDKANYVVLLSDSEANSYTLNEALYRNIPIISTPLPYLEEIGVKDGINAWILNFDCSNIQHIVDNIKNVPKFTFKKMEDKYNDIFFKSRSTYQEELHKYFQVQALNSFSLSAFKEIRNMQRHNELDDKDGWIAEGDIFECNCILKDYLEENGVIRILKEIN